jgi:hypothetical protein
MKNPRVKIIKNNIEIGTIVPMATNDAVVGQFIDNLMEEKGHSVDKHGLIDLPEYGCDNKVRNLRSKANHSIGSMTIQAIIDNPIFENTRFHKKSLNLNTITVDGDLRLVTDVKLVDMDIDVIRKNLEEGYLDCREQLIAGCRTKEIKSNNGWVVFDGYNHPNSYRMRIPNKAMKKIHTISGNRDQFIKHFEVSE